MTTFIQQERIVCRALIAISCFLLLQTDLRAQTGGVDAWVSSVRGDTQRVSRTRLGQFLIKRGDPLANGDEIVTGNTGRVVIALSDGSQIIVFPNSRVLLKDFRAAQSMRELLEIAIGTVRVKIRHIGNRPNPYRLNSPAASIAVRGTEFTVDVKSNGETMVAVSEGLVEVSPLSDPTDKRQVGPGEFIIIRADGRIGMAIPGPGGELNGRSMDSSNNSDPVQRVATAYQRSIDSVAQSSLETPPMLFGAFADAHRDSLENPAYASEFKQAQGQLLMMPSISRAEKLVVYVAGLSASQMSKTDNFPYKGGPHRFDYTFTPQFTFFTPVGDSRITLGGSISAVRTSLHALTLYQPSQDVVATVLFPRQLNALGVPGIMDGAATKLAAINGSLVAARSFGKDRNTSLGLQLEQLTGSGSFLNVRRRLEVRVSDSGISFSQKYNESETEIAQTRVTFGAAHEFNGGKKLGVYYRYGEASVNQQYLSRSVKNELFLQDKTEITTATSEIGARWRSPISRRIFYGLETSYLYEQISGRTEYVNRSVARERDLARRTQFGGGLGFALRRNTLFSFDLAGGLFNTTKPSAEGAETLIRVRSERGDFISAHAAAQTDLGRKAFASASFLVSTRKSDIKLDDRIAVTPFQKSILQRPYRQSFTGKFSSVGVGWKFKPNLITEYLLSMDHNRRAPSHSLLLQYTFDVKIFGED